jgi:hypothetical protein
MLEIFVKYIDNVDFSAARFDSMSNTGKKIIIASFGRFLLTEACLECLQNGNSSALTFLIYA